MEDTCKELPWPMAEDRGGVRNKTLTLLDCCK